MKNSATILTVLSVFLVWFTCCVAAETVLPPSGAQPRPGISLASADNPITSQAKPLQASPNKNLPGEARLSVEPHNKAGTFTPAVKLSPQDTKKLQQFLEQLIAAQQAGSPQGVDNTTRSGQGTAPGPRR